MGKQIVIYTTNKIDLNVLLMTNIKSYESKEKIIEFQKKKNRLFFSWWRWNLSFLGQVDL